MIKSQEQTTHARKSREDFFIKYLFISFEMVVQSLRVRGSWRPNIIEIFGPHRPSSLCLSRSLWLLNRALRVHSPGCWLFLLHCVYVRLQLYCLSSTLLACLCSRLSQFVGLILPSNSHALIWTRIHDYF